LPSVKLQSKERVGARLRRRYGAPCTPLDRVQRCPQADRAKVAALVALRDRLDPFALAARIDRKLERVYALANVRRGQTIKDQNLSSFGNTIYGATGDRRDGV
jgi:hypothetical protein